MSAADIARTKAYSRAIQIRSHLQIARPRKELGPEIIDAWAAALAAIMVIIEYLEDK